VIAAASQVTGLDAVYVLSIPVAPSARRSVISLRTAPITNVGLRQYAAAMTNQADPGDSPPSPGRPSRGRKPPGGPLTPHDSVFRRILGVPENMASQLRAVLPPDAAARLDLGRLARVPGSFVDEALKWRHSDLLFTAPWRAGTCSYTCWWSTRAAATR
jgi:hypothetical protein